MIYMHTTHRRLTFRIRSWFWFVLLFAVALATWRSYQPPRIGELMAARDSVLREWRQVHRRLHAGDSTVDAQQEAALREIYFQRRAAIEAAISDLDEAGLRKAEVEYRAASAAAREASSPSNPQRSK